MSVLDSRRGAGERLRMAAIMTSPKQRRRAGDPARAAHRPAVEVADPHAHAHLAGVANRPVVAIALRGPGLRCGRKVELQHAAAAEGGGARV